MPLDPAARTYLLDAFTDALRCISRDEALRLQREHDSLLTRRVIAEGLVARLERLPIEVRVVETKLGDFSGVLRGPARE